MIRRRSVTQDWPQQRLHAVAGRAVPLAIFEHERARRLTLRIGAGGRSIRVTVPPGIGPAEVERFLLRHQEWLEARLAAYPAVDSLAPGMSIPLRGIPHAILHRPGGRVVTRVVGNGAGPGIEVGGDACHLGRRIADFLKAEAGRDLRCLVARHSSSIRVKPGRITLRDTASRWGSCAANGNLSFSWRIVMAPPAVIDYLAAHEVAHLQEMNHGAAFWKLCAELCPRTPECRDWLKRNGAKLHAIPFERV